MATRRTNTGSKLCTPEVRVAIYLRDSLRCVYCRIPRDAGRRFSLDHVVPFVAGGSDAPTNLVTACQKCNSSKKDLSLDAWITRLEYKGVSRRRTSAIRRRVATALSTPLEIDE